MDSKGNKDLDDLTPQEKGWFLRLVGGFFCLVAFILLAVATILACLRQSASDPITLGLGLPGIIIGTMAFAALCVGNEAKDKYGK